MGFSEYIELVKALAEFLFEEQVAKRANPSTNPIIEQRWHELKKLVPPKPLDFVGNELAWDPVSASAMLTEGKLSSISTELIVTKINPKK